MPEQPSTRRALLRLAVALAGSCRVVASAQTPARTESIEAAYLHKLPGFVEWPAQAFASPSSPIVIGVAGAAAVLDELVRIAKGRLVVGRAVEGYAVESAADLPRDLHVLFIGADAAPDMPSLVSAAHLRHALVVSDLPDGLAEGAAIEFVQVDGRLRFEVSLPGARQAELKLSSQLMGVAWKVVEEDGT